MKKNEKKTKRNSFVFGITLLLLGMALNLQYTLDDYGIARMSFLKTVIATYDDSGTHILDGSHELCNSCASGGGIGVITCSCSGGWSGFGGGGTSCQITAGSAEYACCKINSLGACSCRICMH